MKFSLKFRLLVFDILALACVALPVLDYFYIAGPQVRALKVANQALKETTVSVTLLNRYERDVGQVLNRLERSPNPGYLFSLDGLAQKIHTVLSDLDATLKRDPLLEDLGDAYSGSELSRLSIARELAVAYLQNRPTSEIQPLRLKLQTAEEFHMAISSDLTTYLANVSADYAQRGEQIESRLMYSSIFYLLVAVFLIAYRHWYMRTRVLRPIEWVHNGQKKIESGLFPGPIQSRTLEPEIQSLVSSFNGMERGIRDFYEYTSILTSATVHDLKEPFAAILSFKNLFQQGSPEDFGMTSAQVWDRVGLNCGSGIDLIDNLLQYTRSSMGKVDYSEVNPSPVVKEIFEKAQQVYFDQSAVLKIGSLQPIWCDQNQLKAVLRNAIINAFKYADKEKEFLEIELWADDFRGPDLVDYVRFHVRDNGMGFEMEAFEILNNPFEQLNPRNEKHQEFLKGVGLGLSICHRILQGHRGLLEARSRPGKGTEFVLFFPKKLEAENRKWKIEVKSEKSRRPELGPV